MNKAQYFLKQHSSTILTVVGAVGVVGTAVLSVKATPKALALLEEAKEEKGEDLTPLEVVETAWKPYIPALITGVSTIACIFGANILNSKSQASLMSAYALLDQTYKEYRNKVKELYEEEADTNVAHEILKSKFDEDMVLEPNKILFCDFHSLRFFETTMDRVMFAENAFLETLHDRGYACLNEYYDLLGIPHVEYGFQLGWFDFENNDPYNCSELEFNYEKVNVKDDVECFMITTNMPPAADYIL